MKDATKFYIREQERFVEVLPEAKPKGIVLAGYEEFDLFIHKDNYGLWVVTEGQTGLKAGIGQKQAEAKADALARLDRWGLDKSKESIQYGIEHSGLSPRYGGEVEAGKVYDPFLERLAQNKKDYLEYSSIFKQTFGVSLQNYWDKLTRLDVIKFDEEVVQPADNVSTKEAVEAKYGKEAMAMVITLL